MYKKIMGCLLILMLSFSSLASADNESIDIKSLEIQIMPEFISPADWPKDTPSLLTGMYGTLINEGTTPYAGPITIQIPKAANTSINVVAEFKDQQSEETDLQFEFKPDQQVVVWTPKQAIEPNQPYYFVVEYYSNPFTINNKEHAFNYSLTSLYKVDDVQLYFYKPTESIDFKLSEKSDKTITNEMGQEIYQLGLGALQPGVEKKVTVQYLKENFETVMEKHSKTAQQNSQSATAGSADGTTSGANAGAATGTSGAASSTDALAGDDAPKQDATKDSWIIGGSIVIFGLLVFMGLRSYRAPHQPVAATTTTEQSGHKLQKIRELRKQLLDEQLTEEEYLLERKKWI